METKYKMFLLAAQELNFTRAAGKAFVTQQCLSDHIQKLEKQYGVPLFERRPQLSLTLAGKTLYRHLLSAQNMEHGLNMEMEEIRSGARGSFTVGMNVARARVLLPQFIAEYQRQFPNVKVSFVLDDTVNMIKMLIDGKLDMCLATNTPYDKSFEIVPVLDDDYCIAVSHATLRAAFPDGFEETRRRFFHGVRLDAFRDLSFVTTLNGGLSIQLIQNALMLHNINFNLSDHTIFQISDFETQFALCREAPLLALCPELVVNHIMTLNAQTTDLQKKLYVFPLEFLEKLSCTHIVSLKDQAKPNYIKVFQEMLIQSALINSDRVKGYLSIQEELFAS